MLKPFATEQLDCGSAHPPTPVEFLRRKARALRDEAHASEKLADQLENLKWTPETSSVFFSVLH